jgi:hypothetical protein
MRAKAALIKAMPPMSSLNQAFFMAWTNPMPFHCDGAVNPNFYAFLLFRNSVRIRGKNITGRMIHHIP